MIEPTIYKERFQLRVADMLGISHEKESSSLSELKSNE